MIMIEQRMYENFESIMESCDIEWPVQKELLRYVKKIFHAGLRAGFVLSKDNEKWLADCKDALSEVV